MIDFSLRVTVPDTVLFRDLGGEAVILNLDTESYLGLDAVGTRMWTALTTRPTVEGAYEQLLAEYDVMPETLRADIERLISEMLEHDLIKLEHE